MTLYRLLTVMAVSVFYTGMSVAAGQSKLEPLYAVSLFEKKLEFAVKSTGCSAAEDFKLHMRSADDQLILAIERIKVDRCRRMPKVISLTKAVDFSNIDSNLDIMIGNPFKIKFK